MKVFIFGNPDIEKDSLPVRILPKLKQQLPTITFILKDPNEEWEIPDELVIIDTVIRKNEITIFKNLDDFIGTPRITMHDYDALTNLQYLQKLGRLKKICIIGIPSGIDELVAIEKIVEIFTHHRWIA
ncbi:MAG: hypothetical protein V1652_01620 [bacterium]